MGNGDSSNYYFLNLSRFYRRGDRQGRNPRRGPWAMPSTWLSTGYSPGTSPSAPTHMSERSRVAGFCH